MEASLATPPEVKPTKTPALPPGPAMSRARQTLAWGTKPHEFLDRCKAEFGPTFSVKIAAEGDWVMVSEPEAIKQVFTGPSSVLHAGKGNMILLPVVGPASVLLLDDEVHMRQRKLMLPSFHGERMRRYGDLMTEISAREIESWPSDGPITTQPLMQRVTLEIILRAVFGVGEGSTLDELRVSLRKLLDRATSKRAGLAVATMGPRRAARSRILKRWRGPSDELLYKVIAERREATDLEEREDILSLLMGATDEDGNPLTDAELRDELITLLVAGHETTATALSWAVERLARDPERLARLTAELDGGDETYLDAVVTEILRVRPVISIVVRRLTEPFEVAGELLPAGAAVVPCIHLVHNDPEIYPEPGEFRPERFLEQPPGTYTWIPFGGGVRRCLGAAFAQYEMKAVLRELITRRAIEPAGNPEGERLKRKAITNAPGAGGRILAKPRVAA